MPDQVTDSQPLNAALAAAQAAIDDLIVTADRTGLDGLQVLPADQLLGFAVQVERLRNRMLILDRPIVAALEVGQVAEQQLMRSTAHLLADRLLISRSEARHRIGVVQSCAPRISMTGGVEPASRPVLAAALETGLVSSEQTRIILAGLDKIDRLVGLRSHPHSADSDTAPDGVVLVSHSDVDRAEETLVEQARWFTGNDLGAIASKIIDCLHPDGDPDRAEAHQRSRSLRIQRLATGMVRIHGDLLPDTAQALKAVLTPLARPRLTTSMLTRDGSTDGSIDSSTVDADTCELSTAAGGDDRSRDQRWHDALDDACHRLLGAGGLPVAAGVPATVIVTIDEDTLRTRTGTGVCPDGTRLPIETVLQIAGEAEIVPTVLTATGAVLSQGRRKRIATKSQTLALYARDGGCTFPGCDHPPDWCERHHIRSWDTGGPTDLDNLTLLCAYHHRRFAAHGWTCQLIDGLPHWTAPLHHDPQQTPQLHQRLHAALEQRTRLRARMTVGMKPLIPVPTSSETEALTWAHLGAAPRHLAVDVVILDHHRDHPTAA